MADEKKLNYEIIEDDEIVTLTDDNGKDEEFYVLAEYDYKDKWYIVLEPVEPDADFEDGEVLIYEISSDENGEDLYVPIEDEALLNEVFAEFVRFTDETED